MDRLESTPAGISDAGGRIRLSQEGISSARYLVLWKAGYLTMIARNTEPFPRVCAMSPDCAITVWLDRELVDATLALEVSAVPVVESGLEYVPRIGFAARFRSSWTLAQRRVAVARADSSTLHGLIPGVPYDIGISDGGRSGIEMSVKRVTAPNEVVMRVRQRKSFRVRTDAGYGEGAVTVRDSGGIARTWTLAADGSATVIPDDVLKLSPEESWWIQAWGTSWVSDARRMSRDELGVVEEVVLPTHPHSAAVIRCLNTAGHSFARKEPVFVVWAGEQEGWIEPVPRGNGLVAVTVGTDILVFADDDRFPLHGYVLPPGPDGVVPVKIRWPGDVVSIDAGAASMYLPNVAAMSDEDQQQLIRSVAIVATVRVEGAELDVRLGCTGMVPPMTVREWAGSFRAALRDGGDYRAVLGLADRASGVRIPLVTE